MRKRLLFSLIAFGVWAAITVVGGRFLQQGEASLDDGVSRGVGWQFVTAGLFILAVVWWQRWPDVGLNSPKPWRTLWLAWLPAVYIVGGLTLACLLGLPSAAVLGWVLINACFVGFSEELMFRGVLLQAFRRSLPIWPAVLATSFIFGAIHSLNVFTTGRLDQSLVQSAAAFLSGLIFVALRLRTGSLWPSIVLHALWDFAVFTLSLSARPESGEGAALSQPGLKMFFPVFLVLPNAVCGLWLMRNIGRTHASPDA